MVRKRSKKQLQKQKARERFNRKNRRTLSAKREEKAAERKIRQVAPLPEFHIDTSESTGSIDELVEAGIEGLKKTYVKILDEDTLALMAGQAASGWTDMINEHAAYITDMTREQIEHGMIGMCEKDFGNAIIRNAPENLIRRVLPVSCFTMRPDDRSWVIRCRSLKSIRTRHGCLYQSPHRPEISWEGTSRQIVFTRHALDQLADRILPSWKKHYIGQAYVFGFLYECVYFDVVALSSGQPAAVVYNACLRAGSSLREYMRNLLKVDSDRGLVNHYYKVGYCPLILDEDLAISKTFLTPGYWHTPERQTVGLSKGAKIAQVRDIEMACDDGINIMSVSTCSRTRAAVKWFHHHGVPQVKKIDGEVFRDMAGPYAFLTNMIDDLPTEPS